VKLPYTPSRSPVKVAIKGTFYAKLETPEYQKANDQKAISIGFGNATTLVYDDTSGPFSGAWSSETNMFTMFDHNADCEIDLGVAPAPSTWHTMRQSAVSVDNPTSSVAIDLAKERRIAFLNKTR
jgi:hypothetical protein